jgi:protein-tyrosine phosphatase
MQLFLDITKPKKFSFQIFNSSKNPKITLQERGKTMNAIYMYAHILGSYIYNKQWKSTHANRWVKSSPLSGELKKASVKQEQHLSDEEEAQLWYQASLIEHGIYLSGSYVARRRDEIEKLNIKHILNATSDIPCMFSDLNYLRVGLFDTKEQELTSKDLHCAFEFMKQAKEKKEAMLIHCYAGKSRSASFVIYYLCRTHNWSIGKAMFYIWGKRPILCVNDNFIQRIHNTLLLERPMRSSDEVFGSEMNVEFHKVV